MRREFLRGLGIEEKEIIDKILDENSSDIGKAKGELETYKNKVTDLEEQIKTKDTELTKLQKTAEEVENLKNQVTTLENDKTNLTNELNDKVNSVQKAHAIENKIRDMKGKNVKAIKALLDESKITFDNGELGGIDEQLNALVSAEDSSMLFGDTPNTPSGTTPSNPQGNNGGTTPTSTTLAEAVAKALSK